MSNYNKFFKNGKTFSNFCRYRYGKSKPIWDDATLWQKTGPFAIAFDIEAADAKFEVIEHEDEATNKDKIKQEVIK